MQDSAFSLWLEWVALLEHHACVSCLSCVFFFLGGAVSVSLYTTEEDPWAVHIQPFTVYNSGTFTSTVVWPLLYAVLSLPLFAGFLSLLLLLSLFLANIAK